MRTTFTFLLCAFAAAVITGCAGVPETTLAIVGESDTVTVAEFERSWNGMRQAAPVSERAKADFLELLVDYRVKLAEARASGIEADPALAEEISTYRDQIAVNYLLDKRLIEPGVRQLYDRRRQEVRFSHIIVRWKRYPNNTIDSAATRVEATALLERALKGAEPFDSLIMRYSEDPMKVSNRGSIGWIIAGTTLPQVDDIVYNEAVGAVHPKLMATQFGYHIVKVTGRQKARLRVRASQILYRLDINNPADTSDAYARLSLVLDSLRSGKASFEDLARRNSHDPVSGALGGDLGWMERGVGLEPHFEEALFNLQLGQTSNVERSPLGMHIIRLTGEEDPRPIDEIRTELRAVYQRERFRTEYEKFVNDLLAVRGFESNAGVLRFIAGRMDSSWSTSTAGWETRLSTQEREGFLFRVLGRQMTIREAIPMIKSDPTLQMRRFTVSSLDTIARLLAARNVLVAETRAFEDLYPDFRRLVEEYRESAYISGIEQRVLGTGAPLDEQELRAYWEKTRASYRWPARVAFSEIHSYNEKVAAQLLDSVRAGIDFNELAARHTKRTGMFGSRGSWGMVPVDKNDLSKAAAKLPVGAVSGVITEAPGASILKVDGKDVAREKTFDEARSEAAAKLREEQSSRRMREWLQSLRAKYGVRQFPDHLKNAFARVGEAS